MESSDTYQDFHGGWWGLCYSALPKIIKTGFTAISLIYFFTAGPDEVSASICVDTLISSLQCQCLIHVWKRAGGGHSCMQPHTLRDAKWSEKQRN
jgi:hypothetical protein